MGLDCLRDSYLAHAVMRELRFDDGAPSTLPDGRHGAGEAIARLLAAPSCLAEELVRPCIVE